MPVVINEFEVVPDPAPSAGPERTPKVPAEEAPQESASVERAVRRMQERFERVRAH